MPGMTVIWTALPNGLTGDAANRRLRLSAYVSMRLTTDTGEDGSLATFPAALNWPSLLQPGAFSIAVGGNGVAATTANVISAPPDPVLWQDLFPATTRVASHKIDDLTGRPFNTYQAAAVHDQLRRLLFQPASNCRTRCQICIWHLGLARENGCPRPLLETRLR
jgi:hypothetical protein